MAQHKFDVDDAVEFGLGQAVILEHLRFHQKANEGNPEMEFDGKTWAFIKPATIKKMYPYLSYPSVRRWLKELENDGIIESKKPKERSGYHLTYYHVFEEGESNSQNDNSNSQSESSYNSQNENSSIITNSEYTTNNDNTSTADSDAVSEAIHDDGDSESVKRIAHRLRDAIVEWDPDHKYANNPPSLRSWYVEIDRAMRLDGRTEEQLLFVIDYLFKQDYDYTSEVADFWCPNIQSGKKLRSKFDQLKHKIKKEVYEHSTKQRRQQSTEQAVSQIDDLEWD